MNEFCHPCTRFKLFNIIRTFIVNSWLTRSDLTLQPSQVMTPKWIPFPTSEQIAHICWPSVISTWAGLTVNKHTKYTFDYSDVISNLTFHATLIWSQMLSLVKHWCKKKTIAAVRPCAQRLFGHLRHFRPRSLFSTERTYQWKNFENPSLFVKVTASDKVGCFLRQYYRSI